MKTLSKSFLMDVFSNSINRNLILILFAALIVATFVVATSIVVYNQW